MDITPLLNHRPVKAEDLPLDRLVANKNVPEPEKIAAASRAFEAVLLRQVLSEAQKPAFPSKYSNDSATNGIYRDMVVEQMADSMAKSKSLGLAQSLATGLQRQYHVRSASAAPAGANVPAAVDASAANSAPAAARKPRILRSPKDAAEHAAMTIPERPQAGGPPVSRPERATERTGNVPLSRPEWATTFRSSQTKALSDTNPLPPKTVEITSDD